MRFRCTTALPAPLAWDEVRGAFDEELARLPETLRGPLVLCYLQARTRDEAATQLGISLSKLKRRLTRRGISLAAVGWGVVLAEAPLSAAVAAQIARTVISFLQSGAVSTAVRELLRDGVVARRKDQRGGSLGGTPRGRGQAAQGSAARLLPVALFWDDTVELWDGPAGKRIRELPKLPKYSHQRAGEWRGIDVTADGKRLAAWVWEPEVGLSVGLAFGALGGLVLGSFLAGIREGIRSRGEKSADVK